MGVRVVGVDCATESAKIGLAIGICHGGRVTVSEARPCGGAESASKVVSSWLLEGSGPVLLAMDAPLGWPKGLASALKEHRAGEEILIAANNMFRRATDRFIQERVGKTPLDVGADRIARTALSALSFLGDLRRLIDASIPLAWEWPPSASIAAIEVYPAATLVVHGLRDRGYKKKEQAREREVIIDDLRTLVTLPQDVAPLRQNADALDAVICLLAAQDFLTGQAISPPDREVAEREGWIWTRGTPTASVSEPHD